MAAGAVDVAAAGPSQLHPLPAVSGHPWIHDSPRRLSPGKTDGCSPVTSLSKPGLQVRGGGDVGGILPRRGSALNH